MNFIKTEKFVEERLALFILKQVSLGLDELHRNNIVHGYINMENIELDVAGNWKLSMRSLILKAFYLSPEYKVELVRSK
jgi:serine/threonine protein kinase